MLQTLMVKLGPSPEQHKMLCETMKRFNEACNHIAETVFALHSANKVEIHKTVYYPVRDQFGLSSQLTIRAISKVCEAYKRDKSIKPEFRLDGAIVYDQRILSWKGLEKVSLITLQGRQTIPVKLGEYQKARDVSPAASLGLLTASQQSTLLLGLKSTSLLSRSIQSSRDKPLPFRGGS